MPRYLLTGAGFTANWGGLTATQFFGRLLREPLDEDVRAMLIKTRSFETVMASLQSQHAHAPTEESKRRLDAFTSVLLGIFNGMNNSLARVHFEFQNSVAYTIAKFLQQFDAIFTLNQDGLLEMHYIPGIIGGGRWDLCGLPGMGHLGPPPLVQSFTARDHLGMRTPNQPFQLNLRHQPYFKLHGSANWVADSQSGPLLILGGQKTTQLNLHPILVQYLAELQRRLNEPDAKLMVIGYGFNDEHINDAIAEGVRNHLKLFVVDPRGIGAFDKNDHSAAIPGPPHPFTELLNTAVIGESRHPLTHTFGERGEDEHLYLNSFFR
jgi:hypothetical protein